MINFVEKTVQVRIKESLRDRAKAEAALRHMTLEDYVCMALHKFLPEPRTSPRKK
jgi:predicted HicB family RNase H-like nuclease